MSVWLLAACRQLVAASLLLLLLMVQTAMAESRFPAWIASLHSGSDRLALFSAVRAKRANLLPALQYRTGGMHQGVEPEILHRFWGANPILNYASNFNGGVPAKTLFGGTVTEDSLARSGVVAGASAYGGLLISDRHGSILTFQSYLSAEWLAGKGLNRQQLALSGCNQRHITGWVWIDGCVRSTKFWRNYGDEVHQHSVDLGPTFIYRAAKLDQQLSIKLQRSFLDAGVQNGITADWTGAVANLGAVSVGLQWAQKLKQENLTLRGLTLGLRRPTPKGTQVFGLELSQTGGFTYVVPLQDYRIERVDRTVTASVFIPLRKRFQLRASVGRRMSNVDAFDETFGRFNILTDW